MKENYNQQDMQIGRAGEYMVLADLLMHGHEAFPTAQGMNYDIVLSTKDNNFIRLQVKTTRKMRLIKTNSNPIYFFNIKRAGKKGKRIYEKGEFDGYAFVGLDKKQVFYALFNECKSNSVCVRDKNISYLGHRGGSRPSNFYYQDMTLDNFLKKYATQM